MTGAHAFSMGERQPGRDPTGAAPRRSGSGFRGWLSTVIPTVMAQGALPHDAPDQAATVVAAAPPPASADDPAPPQFKPRRTRSVPPSPAPACDPPPAAPDHDLARLCDRLDELTRQLERLVPSAPANGSATDAGDDRRAADPLDDAIAEIAARQRQLDDASAAAPSMFRSSADGLDAARHDHARAPDLSRLEQQLKLITAQLEILRSPCRADELVADLRQELAGIARALDTMAPRSAFEALESEVRALGARLDESRNAAAADGGRLHTLDQGLAEMRDALRALAPIELENAIRTLSQKIDQISDLGGDPLTLQQLDAAINALRGIVAQVASGDALAAMVKEVRALGEKIEQAVGTAALAPAVGLAAGDHDLLVALERQIGGIAEALKPGQGEAVRPAGPTIEPLIEQLAQKLDRFDLFSDEPAALGPIKQHIAELGEKIDRLQPGPAPEPPAWGPIEERLGHIAESVDRINAPAPEPPALAALEAQVRALAEKIDRWQDSPPGRADIAPIEERIAQLAETLSASEARLGSLEAIERGMAELLAYIDGLRRTGGGVPAAAGASRDRADDAAPGRGAAPRAPIVDPDLWMNGPSEPPSAAPASPADAYATAGRSTPVSPPPPIDPPPSAAAGPRSPDSPMEPGSGPPRGRPSRSAAERIAVSQAALDPPPAERDASPSAGSAQPNFIVAARRAARAASEQQSQAAAAKGAGADDSPRAVGRRLARRVKSLFVTSSVVLVGLGAAGIVLSSGGMLGWVGGQRAKGPTPAATARVAPGDATAAARKPTGPSASAPSASTPSAAESRSFSGPEFHGQTGVVPGSAGAGAAPAQPNGGRPYDRSTSRTASADITGAIPPARDATRNLAVPPAEKLPQSAGPPWSDPLPPAIATKPLLAGIAARNPAAAYEIALRYADGRGVTADLAAAALWFARAAEGGLAPAQFRLGSMHEKGLGVKKDLGEARRLYLAAAGKGNANAMHNIAVLYAEGIDGRPDFAAAGEWFRKAAAYGVADSQYNLAILHARGIGVDQNLAEAFKWFAVVAQGGDKDAAKKRDDIAERLDPQTLSAARAAASVFAPLAQPEEAIAPAVPPGGWDDAGLAPTKPKTPAKRAPEQTARL